MRAMRILFITRNFPPRRGGMERVAYALYSQLSRREEVILLKWAGPKKLLFLIIPYFFLRASLILMSRNIDIVYLNEGFLSLLGFGLKIFGRPVAVTIHGLDITYSNKIYQFFIPRAVASLDKIICISHYTKKECLKRGIPEEKVVIIPDGCNDEFFRSERKVVFKKKLSGFVSEDLTKKKIILSVCRLIERKGIHWFIENVIPQIVSGKKDFLYIVIGDGPLRGRIERIIHRINLSPWVKLLGSVKQEALVVAYNAADIFVMPNIPVEGDAEGFGVVALEAASCGLPVLASHLEGIPDALLEGKLGVLIPSRDKNAWKDNVVSSLDNKDNFSEEIRNLALQNFHWSKISHMYMLAFEAALQSYR